MTMINKKNIFMIEINAKRGFTFTIKDCREIEAIIDWYENQLQKKDTGIDECIKFIKYRLKENDGRVNARMETRYYNELLEKLQQAKIGSEDNE